MAEIEKPLEGGADAQRPVDLRRAAAAENRWRTVKLTVGTAGCLFALTVGILFGRLYWGSQLFRDNFVKVLGGTMRGDPMANWRTNVQFPGVQSLNVLVLGVDHDYDNKDQIIWSSPGRSDSILLARVDFINNSISALTIPRDSAVHIPDHSGIHKINAAHNLGGAPLSMKTIEQVFGVKPDACVVLNFEGFQQLIDAIGGIEVNVPKKLDYDDNWGHLHIHLKPGYQHLNGYNAMGFVRMRHSDSDEMRSKRQHEFLEAMRTKIKNPSTWLKLPAAIDRLNENLKRQELTKDQMYALVNFTRTLPRENITMETLPSFEGPSFVTIDPVKSAQVIQRIFFPNQVVALNIDAPDPNDVRSLERSYLAPRHHERRHRAHVKKSKAHSAESTTPTAADPPAADVPAEPAPAPPAADPAPNTGG